jgi:hypothetical protein
LAVVYRPASGTWYILLSSTSYVTPFVYTLGSSTDIPVPADYDGDGQTDLAVYQPSNGHWTIELSTLNDAWTSGYSWGGASDIPVAADYDGDGKVDLAVYRPANGLWYVLKLESVDSCVCLRRRVSSGNVDPITRSPICGSIGRGGYPTSWSQPLVLTRDRITSSGG